MARLLIETPGQSRQHVVHLSPARSVWIGSAPDCGVVVDAPGVAPRHFRLEHHKGRYLLVRERKGPAVYVRGAKVRRVMLRDGEHIEFGEAVATFRDSRSPKAAEPITGARHTTHRDHRSRNIHDDPGESMAAFDKSDLSWYSLVKRRVRRQRQAASRRLRRRRPRHTDAERTPRASAWRRLPMRLALGSLALGATLGLLVLYQGVHGWPDRYHRAATQALNDGDLAEAAEFWTHLLADAPNHSLAPDARRGVMLVDVLRALEAFHQAAHDPTDPAQGFLPQARAFVSRSGQFIELHADLEVWIPWAHKVANGLEDVSQACLVGGADSLSLDTVELGLRACHTRHRIALLLGEAAVGSLPTHPHWTRLRRLRAEARFAARLGSVRTRIATRLAGNDLDGALGLLHELVVDFPDQAGRPAVTRLGRQLGAALRAGTRYTARRLDLHAPGSGPGRLRSHGAPCPDRRAATVVTGRWCHTYDIDDGRLVWQRRLPTPPAGTPVWIDATPSPLLALPGPDRRLWLVRPGSGQAVGAVELDAPLLGTPLVVGSRLWVPTERGLWEYDPGATCTRGVWRIPLPGPFRLRADPDGKRLAVAADAHAVCVLALDRPAVAGVALTLHGHARLQAAPWIDPRGLVVFQNRGLGRCQLRMIVPGPDRPMAFARAGPTLDGWVWQVGEPMGSVLPIVTDRGVLYGLDLRRRTDPGAPGHLFHTQLERFDQSPYAQMPWVEPRGMERGWIHFAGLRTISPGGQPGTLEAGLLAMDNVAAGPAVIHARAVPVFAVVHLRSLASRLVRLDPERHDVRWTRAIPNEPGG